MVWAIFAILMIIWLVGVIAFGQVLGWFVWIILGLALVNLMLALFTGRKPVP